MGLFGRLFGSRERGAPGAAVAEHTVVIPADLAAELTGGGARLSVAVEAACRAQVKAAAAARDGGDSAAMPFWLDRSEPAPSAGRGDIEDELRDRVIERHSAEGEG